MGEGLGMRLGFIKGERLALGPISALIPALILALVLAGCSGGNDVPALELQVIKSTREIIAAKTAPKTTPPPVTRAMLDTLDGTFLEARLERHDLMAHLYVEAQRRDAGPGQITVWHTFDTVTLTTRNGVLIATRGLGGDILSSTIQVAGARPGPARAGEKIMNIRSLDNKAVRLTLVCELSDLGPETIEIIEHRHATRHLRETCKGGISGDGSGSPGTVVNDYWVDARNGLVWQSRQWAGPYIGYLRLRQLTN
jgi:hypothetical protein